jgi:hypothetical protein
MQKTSQIPKPSEVVHNAARLSALGYSREPKQGSETPIDMRQKISNAVFLGVALFATGGWVWLLYVGVRKLI